MLPEIELDSVHYLPSEVVNSVNFPEIALYEEELATVFAYTLLVEGALADYNSLKTTKINLNSEELVICIELTRTLCEAFGKSSKVCFDILLGLRRALFVMQQVMWMASKYGVQLFGSVSSEGGSL